MAPRHVSLHGCGLLHPGQNLLGQDGFSPNLIPFSTAVHIAGPLAVDL